MNFLNLVSKRTSNLLGAKRKHIGVVFMLFVFIAFSGYNSYANLLQNRVAGKVISANEKSAITGATLYVKGTTRGTATDIDGKFSIEARDGEVLVVSFIGFKRKEVKISGSPITIELEEDIARLDEVVVVGYGTMKRSDLTGAMASVSEEDIKKTVATSLDQALQGRTAGVQVTQNSGTPGGSVSVRIRGINTLGANNEPLYVIDGVPVEGYSGSKSSNVLSLINPSDIVSMEILKDASATAIYGSRASNGVILITTRQGQSDRTRVSYEGYYAIQQLPTRIETMNLQQYARFYNERAAIRGFDIKSEFMDPSALGNGTDWQDELFRAAPMHNHQLSVTGGSEKSTYAFSAGYLNQEGIAIGSGFERITMRLRFDNQATDWLKIGASMMGARTQQEITASDNSLINMALRQTPDVPVKNLDGSWGGPGPNIYGTYTTNPIAEALSRENYNTGTQIITNFYTDISFLKYFTLRNEVGGTIGYGNNYWFQPSATYGSYSIASNGSRSASNSTYWILKNYLTFNRSFAEKHNISAMIGHEAQESAWSGVSGSVMNYVSNDIHELPNGDAETAKNNSFKGSSALESYFGRVNYSFGEKYLFTATLRADGSSKFGPENKWGYFPSAAIAWRINKEEFMSGIDQIGNLKLRLGYGEVGGQNIGNGAYFASLRSSQSGFGPGQLPGNIPNPYVKWEATSSYNAGLDVALWENRLEFIADFYLKTTNDLLLNISLPAYGGTNSQGGLASPVVNIGGLQNKGLELTLNTVNFDKKSFQWRTGLTFSLNKNIITSLNDDDASIYGYSDNLGGNGIVLITRSVVGQPVGQFYGYEVVGMFNDESDFYVKDSSGNILNDDNGQPKKVAIPDQDGKYGIKPGEIWVGDYIYRDQNNDGTINEEDRTFIGDPAPKFEYGISNSFSYKNFDLNIYLTGVYGNKIYNMTRSNFINPNSNLGLLSEVTDYARIGLIDAEGSATDISNVYITNPGTTVSRITLTDYNDNTRTSSHFIEDGSYLRIKNIILGYNLPRALCSRYKIDGLRVYLNVQNLFTFTKYSGYDPEIGAQRQNVLLSSIDQGRYPTQRIWTFGLNLNF
jgi:TonB-dependent starch-binding outer membrane protein SusC